MIVLTRFFAWSTGYIQNIIEYTGLSKRKGTKLRESFCPAAASHSRPRQAGAYQNSPFFPHKSVQAFGKSSLISYCNK